jgi:uncharacterized protein
MGEPLIIVGSSVRAAAQSAVRAGFVPWCIDRRGDRDLRDIPGVAVRVVDPQHYPRAILHLLDEAPAETKLLLAGGLDGEFELLRAIGFEHHFITSPPEAVRKVRWPTALATIPTTKGLKHCQTLTSISFMRRLWRLAFGSFGKTKYLLKPRASYGGQGITWWQPGMSIASDQYLQEYVRGVPISAVYHCDGWSSILLGATEQLIGETCFGASDFAYCGSIGPMQLTERAREALSHLGVILTQRFDMRGVFGIDLVMDFKGDLWPIEVNPRYPASAELLEKITGVHVLTPADGSRKEKKTRPIMHGKAVVYAKQPGKAPDLYATFSKDQVADVPEPGREIGRGAAVCTVYATSPSRDDVFNKLKSMTQQVYDTMHAAT